MQKQLSASANSEGISFERWKFQTSLHLAKQLDWSTLHSPTHSHRLHEESMRTLHESPWILGRLHSAFPIVHMDSLWSLHGLVDSMGTPQTVFHGLLMDSVRPPRGIHI